MTDEDWDVLADAMAESVKKILAPILERLAAVEEQLSAMKKEATE